MNENDKKDELENIPHKIIAERKPLVIFKTDADIYGRNISEMHPMHTVHWCNGSIVSIL